MGYDMYVVEEVTESDSDYQPLIPDQPGYYRLNYVGMRAMVEIMLRAGILDADVSHSEWPVWPPKGMQVRRADELLEHYLVSTEVSPPPTDDESQIALAYLAQRAEIQSTQSDNPGLVPAFKFRSNDQWHVTPSECMVISEGLLSALDSDRASILPDPEESGLSHDETERHVRRFALFNDFASRHGGYRVH
jgi:hypothetical protein